MAILGLRPVGKPDPPPFCPVAPPPGEPFSTAFLPRPTDPLLPRFFAVSTRHLLRLFAGSDRTRAFFLKVLTGLGFSVRAEVRFRAVQPPSAGRRGSGRGRGEARKQGRKWSNRVQIMPEIQLTQIGKPPPLAVRRAEVRPLSGFAEEDQTVSNHELPSSGRRPSCESGRANPHVRWYCRYHVVWVPKYRKRAMFGQIRRGIGKILRELCQRHGVELVEGHALPDHVHLLLGIPPKFSVANTVGFLKGKSAIRIHREYLGRQRRGGPHPSDSSAAQLR